MVDLIAKWREISRQDDCFDHMVPSDVREMLGEIERLRTAGKAALDDMGGGNDASAHLILKNNFGSSPNPCR